MKGGEKMPKKKTTKKKTSKKVSKKEVCMNDKCHCNNLFLKLSSMAFIMFLVTVWPKVGTGLLKVHWGWYLGIFLFFGIATAGTKNNCFCCTPKK